MSKTAIVLPTNLVKGIACATSTEKYREILQAFNVKGTASTNADGSRDVELRLIATDSVCMVEICYGYTIPNGAGVDVPDEFSWIVKPTDKLTGASDYVRIEPCEDGGTANVRTYKANNNLAFGMAMADLKPTSYHVWEMPEAAYPNAERLWSPSLTTVANITVSMAVWGKVEKALTTAFGNNVAITLCGVGTKGAPLEFAVYEGDVRKARALVMPTNHTKPDKGGVDGVDKGEYESLKKAYEAQLAIDHKLANENHELRIRVHELEAGRVEPVVVVEPEIEEPYEVEFEPVAEIPALPAPKCAYFVPEGCTVSVSKVGNVWLEGPKDVTRANADALKADGWKWARQRKQWWRKAA